ncbi:60S ribosomal protein L27a-like [Phyllostomus hastatus]|uniref:60S ribosomal protein L27a-like n=1 Tax=Phyllostomus hastatus TaxID=9423 RepID=UPI001E68129D|nr:60S ribosomal protein L27a-like [Phyllostomus hastatus]
MPSRLRKTQKLQGHTSQGHGCMGKHRKCLGGQGNAGSLHHHRIDFDKYRPGHFGKVGRRHDHLERSQSFCPTVNLDELWTSVPEQTRVNAAKNKTGAAPIIDAVQSGYYKVLGKGKLPKQPVVVKATFFSRRAEKIKSVGGGPGLWELEATRREVHLMLTSVQQTPAGSGPCENTIVDAEGTSARGHDTDLHPQGLTQQHVEQSHSCS